MIALDWLGVLALRRGAIRRAVAPRARWYAGLLAALALRVQLSSTPQTSYAEAYAALAGETYPFAALVAISLLIGAFLGRPGQRVSGAGAGVLVCALVTWPLGVLLAAGAGQRHAEGAVLAFGVSDALAWAWRAAVLARAIVVLHGVRGLVAWTCLVAPSSAAYGIYSFYAHYGQTRGAFGPRTPLEAEHLALGYGAAIVFSLVIPIAIGMGTAVHIMLRDDPEPPAPAGDLPSTGAAPSPPVGPAETACAPQESR